MTNIRYAWVSLLLLKILLGKSLKLLLVATMAERKGQPSVKWSCISLKSEVLLTNPSRPLSLPRQNTGSNGDKSILSYPQHEIIFVEEDKKETGMKCFLENGILSKCIILHLSATKFYARRYREINRNSLFIQVSAQKSKLCTGPIREKCGSIMKWQRHLDWW